MGLSSKQVSVDVLDWSQSLLQSGSLMELPKPPRPQVRQQQQQEESPPLRCPRCDSTNTKFCYYNNYNKSQPRHFCKTCRRHWTKGGTLRNVPVGGGRKNKRLKTSSSSSSISTTTTATTTANTPSLRPKNSNNNNINNMNMVDINQPLQQQLAFPFGDQKSISEILYQAHVGNTNIDVNINSSSSSFMGSTLSLPSFPNFPFTSFSSLGFDNNPSSLISSSFTGGLSFSSPSLYSTTTSSATTTTATASASTVSTAMPWQTPPVTGSSMDSTQFWNWEDDLSAIVTTDLGQPWDDPDDGNDSAPKQL